VNDQNICKFLEPKSDVNFAAANFVFETKTPESHKLVIRRTNILYLVADGEGIYKCGGKCWPIQCGTVFFSFADAPYTIENINELKYYYISFTGERSEELFERFGIRQDNCCFEGYEGMIPLWQDSLVRAEDDNIDLLCESMVLYVFSKLKEANRDPGDIASFILTYMENHFTESDLSLESVSNAAGYHAKYISYVFKKRFAMGFTEYLRLMRIKHAVMLMENGVTCIKNVAFLSGFSDPLYFSKVFAKSVGMSPRDYIREKSGEEAE